MKKVIIFLMCLLGIMGASLSAKAQEITITLNPGWTWISYTNAEAMDIATALGDFTPMQGDIINSQYGSTSYTGGRWRGSLTHFIPGWGYMYYSTRTDYAELVFAQPSSNAVATAMPTDITDVSAVVGGMVSVPEGGHVFQRGVCWGIAPSPDIDGSHSSEETGVGVFSTTLEGLTPSTDYYVRAYAVTDNGLAYGDELSFTTLDGGSNGHEYVDLGLPSGNLWATCNVGANTPEDYGDYFAWGETQPKDYYDWSTYQYANGTSWEDPQLIKYCTEAYYGYNGFTDNLSTLLPEDDAATANWGSDWRMPTQEEWQELLNNTTVTWTTQNGVNGRLFTASNGNSLFLPAAGYHLYSNLYGSGSWGFYWSSSLSTDDPGSAWHLDFDSLGYYMDCIGRRDGFTLRPVRSAQNTAPTGAINGKFTINNNGDQVYFSQGNLQYQASTNAWKFADNQYDYIGDANSNISSTYSGWIDLFGWGTSGWNNGNMYYQPYDTQDNGIDTQGYGYGPTDGTSYTYNLTGVYANADWGVYNPISNGGNQANQWRTLTQPEWVYIFNTRTTSSGVRYAMAKVNNVNGIILLPDDWSSDTYSLSNTNSSGVGFSTNVITALQWSALEQAGAVFLPTAGYRNGTSVYSVGSYGLYWSASYYRSNYAYSVYFNDSFVSTASCVDRCYGQSVRLARVAE